MKGKVFKVALAISILSLFVYSCKNYYKTRSVTSDSFQTLKEQDRDFILRSGSKAFYIKDPVLNEDHTKITCTLDSLYSNHRLHLKNGYNGRKRYKKYKPDNVVLNEVHIYIPGDPHISPGSYTIDLNQVQHLEVIEKDKGRTAGSYIVGALGTTVAALTVAAVIVALTKSSCPFVSAYYGDQFVLQGEIYGGAIYPQLARLDFMPLKLTPLHNFLQIKISNELEERQYTDIADLLTITHAKGIEILADQKGDLHTITQSVPAEYAILNENRDVKSALEKSGDNAVLYLDDSSKADAQNEVVLGFKKIRKVPKGKLTVMLKNSYWLDQLYGELAEGFGSYYTTYLRKQRNKPGSELEKWIFEQNIPLQISLKTSYGWKTVTSISTIGPLAFRKIVVPLELNEIKEDFVEVRLSSGFMFWEIDQVAIDFSVDKPFTVRKVTPVKATTELGENVLPSLQKEDGIYLEQPSIGNVTTLLYPHIMLEDSLKSQTFILKTKGYYEHIRDFKNNLDIKFLRQFTRPNAFPVYGMLRFNQIKSKHFKSLANAN